MNQVKLTNEPYRPANGIEGSSFEEKYCEKCAFAINGGGCHINHASMIFDEDDSLYPKQWQYVADEQGNQHAVCLSYLDKTQTAINHQL